MTKTANQSIKIKEVLTNKDLRQFIRFPKTLYKNCPYYVPSLEIEDRRTLRHHPAKEFCDIRMFLAYKDKKIAGRIAGIINYKCNELKNQQRIRFGWFDCDEDIRVAEALIQVVQDWGRQEKLEEISGPSRFSNMEKQGMLIEGFEQLPPVSAEYNYSYYPDFLQQLGFCKEIDYLQYRIKIGAIPEEMRELSNFVSERYTIKIKKFDRKKDMKRYGREMFLALNQSYKNIYNFIPLTDKEIDYMINSNFGFLDKNLINILVDKNDTLVGFSVCMPSMSKAFQRAKGKLFPFGWYSIYKALRKNDEVDLYLTGVLPAYSRKGIHALYHYNLHRIFIEKRYVYANATQQLETNNARHIWEKYDSELVFKRRCYVKKMQTKE